jgi:thiamine transporter ThiT
MKVRYIHHSGFLIELENILLLFDWWTGDLPSLPDKPLLVFASHSHEDHFSPRIFTLDNGQRNIHFLLGHDIALTPKNRNLWQLSDNTLSKCTLLRGNERTSPLPGITVETLPSTDEGVAFLVSVNGKVIFHAGDLNWWHWEGEDHAWNLQMEQDFKRYAEPLTGRHIDLAMLPIILYCVRWGFGPGMVAATAHAILQTLFEGGIAIGWQSIIGDFLVAYMVLGLAGLFRGKFIPATLVACAARFLVHYVVGATIWAEYMPETFFGMTMTTPWVYSALYNGCYMLPCTLLVLVGGLLLTKTPVKKYILRQDL